MSVSPPVMPKRGGHTDRRVKAGAQLLLTANAPTVTLSRLQSGIGTLSFEAACSAEVGDLRLGCAYELHSGETSLIQSSGGTRFAPPHSRRPVLVGGRDTYEHIGLDLRQTRNLARLALFAFSAGRAPLRWGGTLITSTSGGAEIEVPLEAVQGEVIVLMTLYNVSGEFVLRAEMQPILGDLREASRAFGYDRITWLDARTPVE
jgi:uncharacterized protein involved in tellurium resistance